jgi:hypothetical protein
MATAAGPPVRAVPDRPAPESADESDREERPAIIESDGGLTR